PNPLKGVRLIRKYLDLYMTYAALHDREQLQKGGIEQSYFVKYFMMNGLLISPRAVINSRMLETMLTSGEASEEQQLLAELFQDYPHSFQEMLDEIIPDFSVSFEGDGADESASTGE